MHDHPLDHPGITSALFFPREAAQGSSRLPNSTDGTVAMPDGVLIGYRLYKHNPQSPVLLFFHGNGEVASDYDGLETLYFQAGVSLLVVDYRGYGWSTGRPLVTRMLPDAEAVLDAVPGILAKAGIQSTKLFVKGRSLGSAPAAYLSKIAPERLKGLIIESGYAEAPSLFRRMGIPVPDDLPDEDTLPIYNVRKIEQVHLPLLVIHGEQDTLIPVENGRSLYNASPSEHKTLVTIPGAGHNNLLMVGMKRYVEAMKTFFNAYA